ncbi:MAG: chain length determinant protein EpsF, partial [Gammaproteobacteria bacterium]|nr:chain length determinant protein EpsF [Gammaproteobacteria bacterium]
LDALAREVEAEQQSYEATLKNYYETRMKSQFNQTNISVLSPAIPPQKPSSPDIMLNMLSAIFLGVLLSLILAVVTEILNRRIRTAEDVMELLDSKVLATV